MNDSATYNISTTLLTSIEQGCKVKSQWKLNRIYEKNIVTRGNSSN